MKQEYLPYYISRAALSAGLSLLVLGLNWKSALFSVILFGLFLLYLHSGWYQIDLQTPFTPLRRDARGKEVQRKALILAILVGMLAYLAAPYLSAWIHISAPRSIGLGLGIITYFCAQFMLFSRK